MNVDMKGCPVSRVERQRKEIPKPLNLSIEFDSGSTQIAPNYLDLLDKAADMIKGHPDKRVTIEGHTDSIGSESINMKISHKRSDAVKSYLVKKHNILSTKINSVGFGESKPIAENSTPEGRFKNRRISIVFSNMKE